MLTYTFWVCDKELPYPEFELCREDRRLVISEENDAKAVRVRRELERIRLKASLQEIIKSTGEVYRSSRNVCLTLTFIFLCVSH